MIKSNNPHLAAGEKDPADPGTKNMFQVPVDNLEIWHVGISDIQVGTRSSDRKDLVFPKLLGDTVVNGKSQSSHVPNHQPVTNVANIRDLFRSSDHDTIWL